MKIRLREIPEEGKKFFWNNQTAELNQILQDLIGNQKYEADFFIKPLNSRNFSLTGVIRSESPEQCSRCGLDFQWPIQQRFNEILIPHQEEDRLGKYAKVHHVSETENQGPEAVEYESDDSFAIGNYLHEQVAIAIPLNPAPAINAKGQCGLCHISVQDRSFSYDEAMPKEEKRSPFEALKKLKLQ